MNDRAPHDENQALGRRQSGGGTVNERRRLRLASTYQTDPESGAERDRLLVPALAALSAPRPLPTFAHLRPHHVEDLMGKSGWPERAVVASGCTA
jgi:hypothetical protein